MWRQTWSWVVVRRVRATWLGPGWTRSRPGSYVVRARPGCRVRATWLGPGWTRSWPGSYVVRAWPGCQVRATWLGPGWTRSRPGSCVVRAWPGCQVRATGLGQGGLGRDPVRATCVLGPGCRDRATGWGPDVLNRSLVRSSMSCGPRPVVGLSSAHGFVAEQLWLQVVTLRAAPVGRRGLASSGCQVTWVAISGVAYAPGPCARANGMWCHGVQT